MVVTVQIVVDLHVHCSDGVGRTGTFICIHSQLERLKTEGVIDFFQSIKSSRIQRAGLVPETVSNLKLHGSFQGEGALDTSVCTVSVYREKQL